MMPIHRPALLAIVLCLLMTLSTVADPVPLYSRFEATFTAPKETPAFSDVIVEFTSPSNKVIPWPAFYDGGSIYRVRFMPLEEGRWSFKTISGARGLGDQLGAFEVKKDAAAKNRFLQHGPVRVSKDGTHLEHHDGTPFFFLADTVWNGAMLSKKDHWDTFLDDRVSKSFTGIQFVMCAPWRTAPTNAEGQVSFTGQKDITIHPEYYARIDERMDAIANRGMLSIPVLMWAWGKNDAGQSLPEADAIKLIKYQIARYAAYPVMWILNGDGRYQGEVAERWKRIGRAVHAWEMEHPDFYFPPTTLHPGGRQWPYDAFKEERWMDVYGYQSSHSNAPDTLRWIHSGPMAKQWNQPPVRPYINLEPCYEDHLSGATKKPFTALDVRQACYWSMLIAPPAGLTYGGHGIWSWQEADGLPFDHPYTGMAKRWQEAKDLPGATSMKHLADLFTSLEWTKLRPAPEMLASQPGEKAPEKWIAAARSEDGTLAMLYLPAGGEARLKDTAGLKGEWFNPRSGERQPAEGNGNAYRAPDQMDWVLILKKSQ